MARKLSEKGLLKKIACLEECYRISEDSIRSHLNVIKIKDKEISKLNEDYLKEYNKNINLIVESDRLNREIFDYKIKLTHFKNIEEEIDNALKRIKELEGTIVLMAVKNFKEDGK